MDEDTRATVKEFEDVLKELTLNSRPIITTLTKMAEENISCAQYFVHLLEARIEKCVPTQKLYAFYALDSICKNAGSPYTIYFSKNLFSMYRKTYLIVDNNTRTKMINLFRSWLEPTTATGEPVFDKGTLDRIESFLIKASALHQKNMESMLPTPTISLLLKEIDKLTMLTEERLRDNKADAKLATKLEVLNQLKAVLQREKLGVPALKQVQLQLQQVFAQDQQYLQDKFVHQQKQQLQQQQLQQQKQQRQRGAGMMGTPDILQGSKSPSKSGTPIIPLFNNFSNQPSKTAGAATNASASLFGSMSSILSPNNFAEMEKTNRIAKIKNLYDELNKEGLLYVPKRESIVTLYDSLNTKNNENNMQQIKNNLPPIPVLTSIIFDCKAHFATNNASLSNAPTLQLNQQNILSDNRQVNNSFIHFLYRAKPNKCSLCGKRFGNSPEEKKLQSDHLDWHFRINKRMKGSSGTQTSTGSTAATAATQRNIQSRNWYIPDSEWVLFKDEEIVSISHDQADRRSGKQRGQSKQATRPHDNDGKFDSAKNAPEKDIVAISRGKLLAKYVVVPDSIQDMAFICPICKEKVNGVYDEDSGEWVWKNTIAIENKHFHATCYFETVQNRSNSGDMPTTELETLKSLIE
ncbi:Pcf11p KNAG_0A04300 [Huiozyma naganishii CBS 8797]|uniref:CID domain-containing protein n=1 Tax=Huiozyma naganishii (strain ATCC MYA-139 / BCRC 22969 / CBS 8797 / KCTC 17520 / NBRC 10181 / NCYC 3082 / Yp74L-3) TaxID=1071383 RepID=J7RTN2_HUIN7|nr:hypothetical protein KNAG_0A04300 [Kazachstania naganishii CBS 8797]CCK68107.1 hypothetical protein KNAG_0A04300 [Kazachstania naganishii CBS 8797]